MIHSPAKSGAAPQGERRHFHEPCAWRTDHPLVRESPQARGWSVKAGILVPRSVEIASGVMPACGEAANTSAGFKTSEASASRSIAFGHDNAASAFPESQPTGPSR